MTTPKVIPYIKVDSGKVIATHRHPMFGACVIVKRMDAATIIRTNSGTSVVATKTLSKF